MKIFPRLIDVIKRLPLFSIQDSFLMLDNSELGVNWLTQNVAPKKKVLMVEKNKTWT